MRGSEAVAGLVGGSPWARAGGAGMPTAAVGGAAEEAAVGESAEEAAEGEAAEGSTATVTPCLFLPRGRLGCRCGV